MIISPIRVPSPAKINLFLQVHQQRDDGFHDLKTYFQLIELCDMLTFTTTDDGSIRVHNPSLAIPETADLCFRAAQALQPYCESAQGVVINVEKYIPDGGGLGGGSSNAATVLHILNQLWATYLPKEELLSIAQTLGADVPIFIHGRSSYAEGTGNIFSDHIPSEIIENKTIIIIKPNIHVNTKEIFHSPLLTKRPSTGKIRDLDTAGYQNDFEAVVFELYPEICHVAQQLSAYSTAHLTGTGACIFSVLDDEKKADKISRALSDKHKVFIVKPLSISPLKQFK